MSAPDHPVVFLNPWDRFMGPNRYLLEMLRHAPSLRQRSLVVFPAEGPAAPEYRESGCATACWPHVTLLPTSPRPANLLALVRHHTTGLASLVRRLRRTSPSAIITNTENLWAGGIAARVLRVPHAQIFHALGFENRLGRHRRLLRFYLRFLGLWSHFLIGASDAVAAGLERGGAAREKIRSLPNPIAVGHLQSQAARTAVTCSDLPSGRSPLLFSVGHLSPMKGQDLLIEALPRLIEEFPGLYCLLAGGSLASTGLDDTVAFEARLRRRIESLELSGHVGLVGDTEEVPALLRRADLYVQPSRTESFGRVVAEALVCGTPVVAFDVGGVPEVGGPGALLARPGDAADLAARIGEALRAPEETAERTSRGQEWVLQRFDAELLAPRFSVMVSELLQSAGR